MRNIKFTFSQQEEQQRKDVYGKLQVKKIVQIAAPVMQMSCIVISDEWCLVEPCTMCCNFVTEQFWELLLLEGCETCLHVNLEKDTSLKSWSTLVVVLIVRR